MMIVSLKKSDFLGPPPIGNLKKQALLQESKAVQRYHQWYCWALLIVL